MNPVASPLSTFAAEIVLAAGGLLSLGLGVAKSTTQRRSVPTAVGIGAGLVAVWLLAGLTPTIGNVFRLFLALLAVPALLVAHADAPRRHYAEYVALLLFSTTGMLLLAGADHLLTVFIALELAGLPLVALTALGTEGRRPAEAALKLFLVGAISSAFLLFGLSFVYGATGELSFSGIAAALSHPLTGGPLWIVGLVLVLGGFAFKVAAAPFHLWAPDVYEGAPTPAAAWIAAGSKVAGFAALVRLLSEGFGDEAGPILIVFAAASMLIGNLGALAQVNVRRLLAYSAIAQGGYILAALGGGGAGGAVPALFYTILYAIAALGAFAVVAAVERTAGDSRTESFSGLWQRSPVLTLSLLVFLITLAGLPPFPGFLGKFLLFTAVLGPQSAAPASPTLWLAVVGVVMSAVSLYYYLAVLKRALVADPHEPAGRSSAAPPALLVGTAAALALAVVWIGVQPEPILALLRGALAP